MSATLVKYVLLVMIGMQQDWISELSFAQKQRLQFIEAMLIWDGEVQRSDVCNVFDVSLNHLTRDIKRYRTANKDALEYDVEVRAYRRGRKFRPLFASGSADEYLALLQAYCASKSTAVLPAMGYIADAEVMPHPVTSIDTEVLRHTMHAIRGGTGLSVMYQSFSDTEPGRRTIWPHTLVNVGERWHARAYDEKNSTFRDFVLVRCSAPEKERSLCPVPATADATWHETELVEIVPAPRLSSGQQAVIAQEFGMRGDQVGHYIWSCKVRKCLVGYFLVRNRIELGGSPGNKPARGQHPYLALKHQALAEKYRFSDD